MAVTGIETCQSSTRQIVRTRLRIAITEVTHRANSMRGHREVLRQTIYLCPEPDFREIEKRSGWKELDMDQLARTATPRASES